MSVVPEWIAAVSAVLGTRANQDNRTPNEGITLDAFQDARLERVERMLLAIQNNAPIAEIKGLKVSRPDVKYDGKDDAEAFERWTASIVRWFKLARVVGPDKEETRMALLGEVLEGEASEHYYDRVESPSRQRQDWTCREYVCTLFLRFITTVKMHDATADFEAVKYTRGKGAIQFYNDLMKAAEKLVEKPDRYTIKRRFIDGLPESIVDHLIKVDRLQPELSKLAEWISKARDYEVQSTYLYHRKIRTAGKLSITTELREIPRIQTRTKEERDARRTRRREKLIEEVRGVAPQTPGHRERLVNYRGVNRRDDGGRRGGYRVGARRGNGADWNKRPPPKAADRPQERKAPSDPIWEIRKGDNDAPRGNCHNCNEPGHWARNCPKPRAIHAMRFGVVDDRSDGERDAIVVSESGAVVGDSKSEAGGDARNAMAEEEDAPDGSERSKSQTGSGEWNEYSDYGGPQYTESYGGSGGDTYSSDRPSGDGTHGPSDSDDGFADGRYLFAMRRGGRGGNTTGSLRSGPEEQGESAEASNSVDELSSGAMRGDARQLRAQLDESREEVEYLRNIQDQSQQDISDLVNENGELETERDGLRQRVTELDGAMRDLRQQNRALQREVSDAEDRITVLQGDLRRYYREREEIEQSRVHQEAAADMAIAENRDPELEAARQMFRDACDERDRQVEVLHREIRLLRDWRNVALDEIMEFRQRQQRERASYRHVLAHRAEPGASQALEDCL
ncbi:hypothetical protein K488DRAFT_91406 [Vararia minispora EC-137]|uniref:Uncharacterized protein n=1 Tax=Vararia minispora EC-137 TaxID=1314806 RepID=A0ACB8Q611_9AGAM|nr:hypothetical protein K488DRAFT_91406 [Vararia minispora EC-137]